ncbi:hypothetical protein ACEUZ9_000298 [Paracoccus litorisediminis]|uniref:DUF7933 domain-containing protein n=1 Tax=Paracoccus litorisediminis TaxID=2006130 RepID=UPI003732BB3A
MKNWLKTTLFCLVLLAPCMAQARVDANISFAPSIINAGGTARATITIQNSDVVAGTDLLASLTMPLGMLPQGAGALSNSCGGAASLSSPSGLLTMNLSGGTMPAAVGATAGSCSISFNVTSDRAATFNALLPVDSISMKVSGTTISNSVSAQASMTSTMAPLTLTLSSSLSAQFQGGESGWFNHRIANPNAVKVTGLSFPIDLSLYGNNFAVVSLVSNSCGGEFSQSTLSTTNSTFYENFTTAGITGGAIAANSYCDLRILIKPRRILRYGYVSLGQSARLPAGVMSTDQSVSNAISNDYYRSFRAGIDVTMLADGTSTATVDVQSGQVVEVTYLVQNYNIAPIPGMAIKFTIPTALTVVSTDAGTCGTLAPVSGGLQFSFTQAAAPDQVAGYQTGDCLAKFRLRPSAGGNFTVSTAANYYGTAPYGTTYFPGGSVSISANDSPLDIAASFDRSEVYASDSAYFTARLTNKSATEELNEISLVNRIADVVYGAIIGPEGLVANGCEGIATIPPDRTSITISSGHLAPGASCELTWQVRFGSAAYKGTGTAPRTYGNTIAASDATYKVGSGSVRNWGAVSTSYIDLLTSLYLSGSFAPSTANENSISRMRITIEKRTLQGNGLRDIWISIGLGDGIRIAPVPNFSTTCGGRLLSQPGGAEFKAEGGALTVPKGSSTASCMFYVDTVMPDIADGEPPRTMSSSLYGDTLPGTRRSIGAQDVGIDGPAGEAYNSWAKSASVIVGSYNLDLGISFANASVGGSGSTRVSVTLSNLANIGLDLTGLRVPVDLASSGVTLASVPDPKFSASSGSAANCSGATFIAVPGAAQIELSSGNIAAKAECKFEFTVTARSGGNHVVNIPAHSVVTNEGVTNGSAVAATLTVGYMLSGTIGYLPNVISESGSVALVIEIANTQPDTPENAYHGASPSLTFQLPAYLSLQGAPLTDCSNASASIAGTILTLEGGTFPGESSCKIEIQATVGPSGSYMSTLPAGSLRTVEGIPNASEDTASLLVLKKPQLTFTAPAGLAGVGRVGTFSATLKNPNTAALNPAGLAGIGFTAVFDAGLAIIQDQISSTCTGFSSQLDGDNLLRLSGIRLAAGASCQVIMGVTSEQGGTYVASAGSLGLADFSIAADPDLAAELKFAIDPEISFLPVMPETELPFALEVELSNPNLFPLGLSSFSLPLPSLPDALRVALPGGVMNGCGAGTITAAEGSALVELNAATIAASSSCTLTVRLATPRGGQYLLRANPAQFEYGAVSLAPVTVMVADNPAALIATRSVRILADRVADEAACAALNSAAQGNVTTPGSCLEFTVTVENPAGEPKPARNISVTEQIQGGLNLVSHDEGGFAITIDDGGNLTAGLSALPPGESRSFSYRAMVN